MFVISHRTPLHSALFLRFSHVDTLVLPAVCHCLVLISQNTCNCPLIDGYIGDFSFSLQEAFLYMCHKHVYKISLAYISSNRAAGLIEVHSFSFLHIATWLSKVVVYVYTTSDV